MKEKSFLNFNMKPIDEKEKKKMNEEFSLIRNLAQLEISIYVVPSVGKTNKQMHKSILNLYRFES